MDNNANVGLNLGLNPAIIAAATVKPRGAFPTVRYVLPRAFVGLGSTITESDLTFALRELTPVDQQEAAVVAGGQAMILARELLMRAIAWVGVGDERWPGKSNRDRLDVWWTAIGPRGRRLVESAFIKLASPTDEDIATFLDAGVCGVED